MWTTVLFYATAGLFLVWTFSALWHLRWVRRLPTAGSKKSDGHVRCSVVIAARDEEARIEQTVRHLFAQRGIEAEFIVVNDRSTDRTGEILEGLAREDTRLKVLRVETLPEGWLGKCHACHRAASIATGDWILFTDADCWLKPDVIERAVLTAERNQADHIALTSGLAPCSHSLQASHLAFLISLASWISGVNRDRPRSYFGIGAFNLVRATAYRQCGGYDTLRLTVLDDMRLGLLMRRAGKRTRAYLGGNDAECHWGVTIGNMTKLMEKNYFAAVDFRLGLVVAGSLAVLLVFGILVAGLLSRTVAGLAAAFSPFLLAWPGGILAHRLNWPWSRGLLMPLMFPIFLHMLLNSTIITLRQGGVRWRGTFYSLDKLRAGTVR